MKRFSIVEAKKTFFTGLALLAPVGITVLIFVFVLRILDGVLGQVLYPIIGKNIWGLGTVVIISVIFGIGYLARYMVGISVLVYLEELFKRLPLVKSVYSSTKQIVNTFFLGGSRNSFKQVVMIEYPRKGVYTVGFITNDNVSAVIHSSKSLCSVFIPTTPNPTSGFFLMLPKDDVTILDMTIEEGVKLIVSAGMISPDK